MRVLAAVTLVLLLVITTTSAYIRLAQTGLSCPGAPDCYGERSPRAGAGDDDATIVARALHRIAASTAGALIVVIVFLGWGTARAAERAVAVALLVLAGLLAWLGVHTPSTMPAVMLGNLLGGMAMVALAGWLVLALARVPPVASARAVRPWVWVALGLVGLQIAAGGMIAARHAAHACPSFPACAGAGWPPGADLAAFDPLREMAPPASAAQRTDANRQAIHLAHRWFALPTIVLLGWLGARAARLGARGPGLALVALAVAQTGLGAAQVVAGQPLGLAVVHNVAAALVLVALAALLERSRPI